MNSFFKYLQDTRAEMKHVAWPTQQQTVIFTILVILLSLFTAFYLGIFDYIFTEAVQVVLSGGDTSSPLDGIVVPEGSGTSTIELGENLGDIEFSATGVTESGETVEVGNIEVTPVTE